MSRVLVPTFPLSFHNIIFPNKIIQSSIILTEIENVNYLIGPVFNPGASTVPTGSFN
jgi:hypothetical protein